MAQSEHRSNRLNEQAQTIGREREQIAAQQIDPALIARASEQVSEAEAALTAARTAVEQAEHDRAATAAALASARENQAAADSARARLAAEALALAEVLAVKDGERWPPMIDSLTVADGLEAALGAALGEELTSALNPGAARHWRELPPFDPAPALPKCAQPLSAYVQGPSALARSLSQIGLVETEEEAPDQQSKLLPGQSLVSRSGATWRWDGYTIRAGTPTQAAVRLQQRNRLTALRVRLAAAEQEAATEHGARAAAETASQAAVTAEQSARNARRDWEQKLERARAALSSLRNQAATATARLAAADDQLARITVERDEAVASLTQVRATQTALPDIAELRLAVDQARTALSAVRSREAAARAERDTLAREYTARANRRRVITAERAGWSERAKDAADRVTDLAARQTEAEDTLRTFEARPAEIAARRAEALDALAGAEATHRRAAEILSAALTQAGDADRAARAAESGAGRPSRGRGSGRGRSTAGQPRLGRRR